MPDRTQDIKLTMRADYRRSPSIEAEAEWTARDGPIWYNLPFRPRHAQPGNWIYFIRQGQLMARGRIDRFVYFDGLTTLYTYRDYPSAEYGWHVEYSALEPATVRLPAQGFQGVRYVTAEEAPRFARAFEAEPSPPIWPPAMSWRPLVIEGMPRRWWANRYERSRRGRRLCLAHYGTACAYCGVSLGARYGTAAEGMIEVHHVVPLEAIGRAYVLDPIADLRPVCPNCHTVIHSRKPPYSLHEIRQMLTQAPAEWH